jgi:peptidoglycan hydrolase-like protein with peptidoglycan-binding domain
METRQPISAPNTQFVKRILHIGSKGRDVEYVQVLLDELNGFYRFCPSKGLKATGNFGPETQKYLKFFQYWVDLEKDTCFAYYDKKTSDALEQTYQEYLFDLGVQGTFARTRQMFDDMLKKPDPFDKY